jgi:hypothetical protein
MSGKGADQSHDLSGLGMASERLLGEDETAVHGHVEHASGRRQEADLRAGKGLLQLSRQTGGSGLVVSDDAVLDRDQHESFPMEERGSPRIVALAPGEAKGKPRA